MTTSLQPAGGGALERPAAPSLADVVDTILDKGIVIDAYVQVSLIGIDLLTVNARVVVSGVDTYLRFAEAVNRLDLSDNKGQGLPELVQDTRQGVAKNVAVGALEAAGEKLRSFASGLGVEAGEEPQRDRLSRAG